MYLIGTVAELTGIPRNTLLAWERRYGLPDPGRDDNGYRMYSEEDLALVNRIKGLLDRGHRVGEAVELLRRGGVDRHRVPASAALSQSRDDLIEHLLAFDREAADRVRRRLVMFSFEQCIDEVYVPLLREVGRRWHAGEVSVAQEHYVAGFCRDQLSGMLQSLGAGPVGGRRVVCAGMPGEPHEIGLLAAAVKLALRGFRISYLGADLPVQDVAEVSRAHEAVMVCQSVVQGRPKAVVLDHARRLRHHVDDGIAIAIAGAGVAGLDGEVPGVWFSQDVDEVVQMLGAN